MFASGPKTAKNARDASDLPNAMLLIRDLTTVPPRARGCVVALGNFDGVHFGHRAVISEARSIAAHLNAPLAVLTFEPHPRALFAPDAPPFRLSPVRKKLALLHHLHVDAVFAMRFNRALANMPAERFVDDVLVSGLGVSHVVVGHNFRFGHKRAGDATLLQSRAEAGKFGVTSMVPVTDGENTIFSSTAIREHLAAGRLNDAAKLLGWTWSIQGRVATGRKLGRTLGFPTANIALGRHLRPAFGVYAVRVSRTGPNGSECLPGVANLGRRPTVDGENELLEVHLFDFDGDLYGQRLDVTLIAHLRDEQKFDGLDALRAQIASDSEEARSLLQRLDDESKAAFERSVWGRFSGPFP